MLSQKMFRVQLVEPSPKIGVKAPQPMVIIQDENGAEVYRVFGPKMVKVEGTALEFKDATTKQFVQIPVSLEDARKISNAKAKGSPIHSIATATTSKRIMATQNNSLDGNFSPLRQRPVTYSSLDKKKAVLLSQAPVVARSPVKKVRYIDPSEVEVEEPAQAQMDASPAPRPAQKQLNLVPSAMKTVGGASTNPHRPSISLSDVFSTDSSKLETDLSRLRTDDREASSPDAVGTSRTQRFPQNVVRHIGGGGRSLAPSSQPFKQPLSLRLPVRKANEDSLHQEPDRVSALTRRKGFPNPSSVCYCNAVVQSLLTCVAFEREVMCSFWDTVLKVRNNAAPEPRVFNGLKRCFVAMQNEESANPSSWIRPYVGPRFAATTTQEDAHEFLIAMFNAIEVDLAGESVGPKSASTLSSQLMRKTGELFPEFDLAEFSVRKVLPTTRAFESVLQKGLTCDSCAYFRYGMPETFSVHSLDFLSDDESESPVDVEALLVKNLHDEKLQDLKCEKCSTGTRARLSFSFVQMPRVLVLHNKRFIRDVGLTRKRRDRVLIPKQLDLSEVMSTELLPLKQPALTMPPSEASLRNGKYSLIAAILHYGHSVASGHYVAVAKVSSDSDQWCVFDDERVSVFPADWNNLEQYQRAVYMCFYQLIES